MSSQQSIQKSLIYSEFSEENQKKWFSFTRSKFFSHIDTLYYVIYPDTTDWREDPRKDSFISAIASASALAACSSDQIAPVFDNFFTGPCTRLMNLPDGDKKHRLTPLSAQSFISPGLAPMYPKVTIDSILSTEIRNTSC